MQHVAVHILSVDMTVNVWTSQMSCVELYVLSLWLLIMGWLSEWNYRYMAGKSIKFGTKAYLLTLA